MHYLQYLQMLQESIMFLLLFAEGFQVYHFLTILRRDLNGTQMIDLQLCCILEILTLLELR